MRQFLAIAVVALFQADAAVVLDRIAVVVNDRVIKDSDIRREIRMTSFLNGDPLDFSDQERRKAANRLIDQALIRREIQLARYPQATPEEIKNLLAQVREQRFLSDAAYKEALERCGITEEQLRSHLSWQIAVLHFVEQRFRPGVLVPDEEVENYYEAHRSEFQAPGEAKAVALSDVRETIENRLAAERVNKLFFSWLEAARKETRIQYREAAVK
jgi:hypothetical protein